MVTDRRTATSPLEAKLDTHRYLKAGFLWSSLILLMVLYVGVRYFDRSYDNAHAFAVLFGIGASVLFESKSLLLKASGAVQAIAVPVKLLSAVVPKGSTVDDYRKLGYWFRQHTPAHSSVGYCEIGVLGYSIRPDHKDILATKILNGEGVQQG